MNTFEEMYREQLHARRSAESETRQWIDTAQIFTDKADQLQDDLDEANDEIEELEARIKFALACLDAARLDMSYASTQLTDTSN
jgi:predicted  nucleic acid-binding Zn-ribbon protein